MFYINPAFGGVLFWVSKAAFDNKELTMGFLKSQ